MVGLYYATLALATMLSFVMKKHNKRILEYACYAFIGIMLVLL